MLGNSVRFYEPSGTVSPQHQAVFLRWTQSRHTLQYFAEQIGVGGVEVGRIFKQRVQLVVLDFCDKGLVIAPIAVYKRHQTAVGRNARSTLFHLVDVTQRRRRQVIVARDIYHHSSLGVLLRGLVVVFITASQQDGST